MSEKRKFTKAILFFAFYMHLFLFSHAQNDSTSFQDDHSHVHPHFEVGLSSAAVKLIEEDEITIGFHTHFSTNISHHLPFLAGIGYEYILDEHQHHSIGILFGWNPVHEFILSISPGVTTNSGAFRFTTHFEASYAFEIGKIHVGPAVEYAYSKNDTHISAGIHLGIPINIR